MRPLLWNNSSKRSLVRQKHTKIQRRESGSLVGNAADRSTIQLQQRVPRRIYRQTREKMPRIPMICYGDGCNIPFHASRPRKGLVAGLPTPCLTNQACDQSLLTHRLRLSLRMIQIAVVLMSLCTVSPATRRKMRRMECLHQTYLDLRARLPTSYSRKTLVHTVLQYTNRACIHKLPITLVTLLGLLPSALFTPPAKALAATKCLS